MSNTPKTFQKRSRSSEGETPRPECKQSKMANTDDISSSIKLLVSSVNEIKQGQESMKKMFESKIDKLRNDVLSTIDQKMQVLKSEIHLDLARESSRIDDLANSVHSLSVRFNDIEESMNNLNTQADSINPTINDRNSNTQVNPLSNDAVTVIVKNLQFAENENLIAIMNDIIHKLGQSVAKEVKIAAVTRLNPRFHGKPGLVKMSLENTDQKILILRNKHKLKTDENYKTVFIQGAKSRIERLIENNTRAILRELPQGNQFRLTGNGRILRKTQNNEDSEVDVPIKHS